MHSLTCPTSKILQPEIWIPILLETFISLTVLLTVKGKLWAVQASIVQLEPDYYYECVKINTVLKNWTRQL